MEADWEVEIGPDAPIIDACWPGFVDLRREPTLAWRLPEVALLPDLANALIKLNADCSTRQIWTAKCDLWPIVDPSMIDPYELDATPVEGAYAWACYIDLLPDRGLQWSQATQGPLDIGSNSPTTAIDWCRELCKRFSADPLRCCRVDLIIREAVVAPDVMDIGITAYLTACGASSNNALACLSRAIDRFVDGFEPGRKVE